MIENDIFLGGRCNLDCIFCKEKNVNFFSTQEIFSKIDAIKTYHNSITISGGEPTVRDDFFEILDYSLANFEKVILLSNLKKFSDEYFLTEFKKRRLDKIAIATSFDSHIKEIHDFLCDTEFYDEKIKLLDLIYSLELNELVIGIVISKFNIHYLEGWVDFVKSRWEKSFLFFKAFNSFGASVQESQLFYPNYDDIEKYIKKVRYEYNIAYIPFCKLGENINKSIEFEFISELLRGDNFKDNLRKLRSLFQDNVFLKSCEQCIHFSYCLGIPKNYIYLYGKESISPIGG